jgi:hypothetical protein
MTHLGLRAGYDLQYSVSDKTAKLYLCVDDEDNRVLISGTTPASRQDAVLDAIDETECWSQKVNCWMVAEKNGRAVAKTPPVKFLTHVKPYYGHLTISQIATDYAKMTYPGNGNGRILTKPINDRYYFHLGGKLETTAAQSRLRLHDVPDGAPGDSGTAAAWLREAARRGCRRPAVRSGTVASVGSASEICRRCDPERDLHPVQRRARHAL